MTNTERWQFDIDSKDARIRAAARAERRQVAMRESWRQEKVAETEHRAAIARGEEFDPGLYGKQGREFGEFAGASGDFLASVRDALVMWRGGRI